MKPRATANDWKTTPMPDKFEIIPFSRQLSMVEYQALVLGLIPREMEDRWFVYTIDSFVYIHRSWSGYCIFKLKLDCVNNGYVLNELYVNRESNQYGSEDVDKDTYIANFVIDIVIKTNTTNK